MLPGLKKGRGRNGFLYISRDPLHFTRPSAPIFNFWQFP